MLNWSAIPDLAGVVLLTIAFASVARRNPTPESKLWLTAWVMIGLHFIASVFYNLPNAWGALAGVLAVSALIWAGLLFMWASVPDRHEGHSQLLVVALLVLNTFYLAALNIGPAASWALDPLASLLGGVPLTIAAVNWRKFNHRLRRGMVAHYFALSIFLLLVQHRPGNGDFLAENAVLFTVYFGCCLHFFFMYRRETTGAFITIAGFLTWALVFVIGPAIEMYFPSLHVQNEVWNLPKYLVAVGMILLLLEEQIAHNQHLALHDALTALPNRRLFHDRLATALGRAKRTASCAALMVIDLDGFKDVNDSLGHHAGDLLLQRVGAICSARVRRSDTVARTGGDEFCVILEGISGRQEALDFGHSLMQLLGQPHNLGDHNVRVGASIGIAVFPEDATDLTTLCIRADQRMYETKHAAIRLGEAWVLGSSTAVSAFSHRTHPVFGLAPASNLLL